MRHLTLPLALALLAILAGCAQKPAPPAPENAAPAVETPAPETENAPEAAASNTPGKVKVVAYINITSGCQASTVKLINDLAIKYPDLATVEFVDFGDGDTGGKGAQRWADDGLNCMTILFNGSPVLRIPDSSGQPKTVVFAMPEGFSWTFDDMKAAFAAMKSGKLEILTEEQARSELAPKTVKVEAKVVLADGAAEVQINGTPIFTLKAKAAGKTPAQRAEAAKAAINKWGASPILPSQLAIAMQGKEPSIQANDIEIIRVTAADAKAVGETDPRALANTWLKAITGAIAGIAHASDQAAQ